MGAWGIGTFENDDSMDFVCDVMESEGFSILSTGLTLNVIDYIYLQAPKASIIVAAAEIIAAGIGKPSKKLPEELENWIASQGDMNFSKLAPKAKSSLKRVLGARSELRSLWSETDGDLSNWIESINKLQSKLKS